MSAKEKRTPKVGSKTSRKSVQSRVEEMPDELTPEQDARLARMREKSKK